MAARRTCAPTTARPARPRRGRTYLITVSSEFIGRDPQQASADRSIAMNTGSLAFGFTRKRDVGKYVLAARVAACGRKG
jgi:hypothetical protein